MKFFVTTVLFLLMFSSLVGAFGVSSPYWEGYPLVMSRGEEKIVNFNLQNMVGSEDVNVKVELKEGRELASLDRDSYFIKAGTSDNYVPLRVKGVNDGKVRLEFKTVTPGGGGVVTGTGMLVTFDVIVSEAPQVTGAGAIGVGSVTSLSMVVAAILILATVLIAFRRRRK